MKVLWITNTTFPAPSTMLNLPVPVKGGWMYSLADQLALRSDIQLAVATIYPGKDLKVITSDNVRYYLLPCNFQLKYDQSLESFWQHICSEFVPDIVHIHGTEFSHGLACMRACQTLNYAISIQGLIGVYSRYCYAGLSWSDIIMNITFRDIVRWNTVFHEKHKLESRGAFEREYLQLAKHVIGRTQWDYTHAKAINPTVTYHHGEEMLRNAFYSATKWSKSQKVNHLIFLSQATHPIKGMHQVLKAVALLVKEFPGISIHIAGYSLVAGNSAIERLKTSGYSLYISRLIKQYNLNDRVKFTGQLSEWQMIAEYQKAHLFVCPSSIENSPNSVGEAQILGVPTIASFVGGIPDMITHGETGLLYRFEEIEMLAENIRRVFTDDQLAERLSKQEILAAEHRHHRVINRNRTIDIYRQITS